MLNDDVGPPVPWGMKITIVGPKIRVVESIWCDPSKLVPEGKKPMKKDSAQEVRRWKKKYFVSTPTPIL